MPQDLSIRLPVLFGFLMLFVFGLQLCVNRFTFLFGNL